MIDESYNLNEIKDSTYYRHLATLKGLEPIYNTPLKLIPTQNWNKRIGI